MKRKPLVVLCGGMGAGKDVVGLHLAENQDKEKFHFSFATPLKDDVDAILKFLKELDEMDSTSRIKKLAEEFSFEEEDAAQMIYILKGIYLHYPEVNARSREPEIRLALQLWGSGVRRKQNINHWVDLAKAKIEEKLNEGYFVYITDGRFVNEFKVINDLGGVTIGLSSSESTRVKRIQDRDGATPSREQLSHSSEKDWKDYKEFDIVIDNDKQTVSETNAEALKRFKEILNK